jgi:hypothetical protein
VVDGNSITTLLPNQFSKQFTYARLPEIRLQEGQTVIAAPYFFAQLLSDRRRPHR